MAWIIGGVVLAYLAAFAWRFAEERLYADSGYYLARVINEGAFRIEHGRWVLALAQLPAWLGAKLGLSMQALILLHSLANVLLLAIAMLIAGYVLRDARAVIAIALLHVIGLSDGLFCPVFELYYAADLLVLFVALLRSTASPTPYRMIALVALLMLIASSHLFAAALLAGIIFLHMHRIDRRQSLLLSSALIAQLTLHAFTLSAYEKDHLAFVKRLHADALAAWLRPATWGDAFAYASHHYPDALLLMLVTLVLLIRQRRGWQAAFIIAFLLAATGLILLKEPGFLHDRYREQLNFPVVAWLILMLTFFVDWSGKRHAVLITLVALTLGYRMVEAERLAPFYQERTAWIKQRIALAQRLHLTKAIVTTPVYFGPVDHAIEAGWSLPVESLLLSAEESPSTTVSIIGTQDLQCPGVAQGLDELVFRCWDIVPARWLDERWFTTPHGRYVPLPSDPMR